MTTPNTNLELLFELDPHFTFELNPEWVLQHNPWWVYCTKYSWLKQNKTSKDIIKILEDEITGKCKDLPIRLSYANIHDIAQEEINRKYKNGY